ncbi:MAG: UDP-N-acetylmuramoyl-tripeptide--D-alanyl-D-alanine ligase [Bradymonadaceae bacterium]
MMKNSPELRIQGWSLAKITAAMGGICQNSQECRVRAVSTDTRNLGQQELFVALEGENFDAHDFVAQAAQAGAAAAVVHRPVESPAGFPIILVDDTLEALSALGHALWQEASEGGLHTIAVTGSNGKTTTKEILASLWGSFGVVHATAGNLNNHIGVPLTLCALPARCDHLIVEMGANGAREISALIAFAPAGERIITSIGAAHLEGFGSIDGVRRAKAEIFEHSESSTAAIVPFGERANLIPESFPGTVWTVGTEEGARVRITGMTPDPERGVLVTLQVDSRKWSLSLPVPGVHNAINLGSAFATLLAHGLDPQDIRLGEALAGLSLPQGRWREVQVGAFSIIDDAYNANPSSVRASLEAFLELQYEGSRYVVLGEMRELGADAERLHEELARDVAGKTSIDGFAILGSHARAMARAACDASPSLDVEAFDDIDDLVSWLEARQRGLVFLKASRGSRLERIITRLEERYSRS